VSFRTQSSRAIIVTDRPATRVANISHLNPQMTLGREQLSNKRFQQSVLPGRLGAGNGSFLLNASKSALTMLERLPLGVGVQEEKRPLAMRMTSLVSIECELDGEGKFSYV
jgi:hypothetical protein